MSLEDRNRINRIINLMGTMEITEVSQEKLRLLDTEQLLAFYGIFGTLNSPRAEAMVQGIARELKRRKYTLGEEKLNEVDVKALLRGLGKGAKVAGKGLKTVIKKGYPIANKMVKGTWMISKKIGGAIGELMDDPEFRKLFTKYVDNPEDPNRVKKIQAYTDGFLSDTPLSGMESVEEAKKVIASVELWNGKKMKKSFKNQSAAEKFIKKMQDQEDVRGYNMYAEGLEENIELTEKKIAGLVKKAEKSGISYGILKQVYNRGMAAWKGGHRPGTTPQQWAFARVNSFITKSKGTWGGADKDLAAKVRGKSESTKDIRMEKLRIEKICSIVLGKDFDEDFIYEDIDFTQPPSAIKKAYKKFINENRAVVYNPRMIRAFIKKVEKKFPQYKGEIEQIEDDEIIFPNDPKLIKFFKGAREVKFVLKDSVSESTAEYAKSLEKIANDRKMKSISKKDKETLKKIAALMSKANEDLEEAVKFWTVTITKKAGKLFKGQTVDVKARNSAEAIKKGIKQMKGNPALVPSDSVDAVLSESK